jgi:hypothetical protein
MAFKISGYFLRISETASMIGAWDDVLYAVTVCLQFNEKQRLLLTQSPREVCQSYHTWG